MSPRRYRMDKRAAARAETRRRIVEATMALHLEQGIRATRWEDIARRADVAVATVYRYFPSLDDLLPACGALVETTIRPPEPERAPGLFAEATALADRIDRLVREWCDFYARSAPVWETVLRERHALPALAEWVQRQESTRTVFVAEALRPIEPDDRLLRVVTALTGYPVWRALVDQGVAGEEVVSVLSGLLRCATGAAPPARS